jgi:hypothetical protein
MAWFFERKRYGEISPAMTKATEVRVVLCQHTKIFLEYVSDYSCAEDVTDLFLHQYRNGPKGILSWCPVQAADNRHDHSVDGTADQP